MVPLLMQIEYPWSRIATRNCPVCRGGGGKLEVRSPIMTTSSVEGEVALLRVACAQCGYTLLFDSELARKTPYQDHSTVEDFPTTFGE